MTLDKQYNRVLQRLAAAETANWSANYSTIIGEASTAFWAGQIKECSALLDGLPTVKSLLAELEDKLKGKRLHQSLKQFREGKVTSRASKLKITSSLLTHCAIECERGNSQFEMLIPVIVEQLNVLAYGDSHVDST